MSKKIISLGLCAALTLSAVGCTAKEVPSVPLPDPIEPTVSSDSSETSSFEPDSIDALPSVPSPTPMEVDDGYVRSLIDVTPDMMNCEYWIAQGMANGFNMDAVLMTEAQIASFNRENATVFEKGDGTELFRMDDVVDSFDGSILRYLLQDNRGQIPSDPQNYYLNGSPTTASYWQDLAALDNLDAVPDTITPRFGFVVKRATLRLFPTEDRVFEERDDQYFDYLLFSECMPFCPAIVLHESSDGNYYYVVFDSFAAWVKKDCIALCTSYDDWMARRDPEQILTVTAREIRLGNDPYSPATTNLVLPMGTHMELVPASSAPASVGQRTTFGDYVVKLPTRGSDGYIVDEYVLIPVSDDVVVGVLPFTSANVVRETFKLLGDRYGWGGDLQANDCTGIVREIYSVFGFIVPRGKQSSVTGIHKVDMTDMSETERLAEYGQMIPGSVLYMPGHAMVYIGTSNGRPFVISAVGHIVQPEPGSNDALQPNSVVLSSLYVRTRSLKTWMSLIKTSVTYVEE